MNAHRIATLIKRALVILARPLQTRAYDYLMRRATMASGLGDHVEATKWARRAARVRSTAPAAWLALGRAAAALRDWKGGLAAAQEILTRDGSCSDAKALRFVCLVNADRASEAVSLWRTFTRPDIQATDTKTRRLAARMFLESGDHPEAAVIARTVGNEEAAAIEVEALLRMRRIADLAEVLTRIDRDLPEDLRATAWFRVNVEQERPSRAMWWLEQLPDEPDQLALWVELSQIFVGENLRDTARDCLDRALAMAESDQPRDNFEFLVAGTRLSLEVNARNTARGFGEILIREFPDHPWSWLWFARALRAEGLFSEALNAVEESISRQSALLPAWEEMTLILKANHGAVDKAVAANRTVIELAETLPHKTLSALSYLAELGDREFVRRRLSRLVSSYPDDRFVLLGQYEILEDLGDVEEAAEVLSQIESRSDPTGLTAVFRLTLDRGQYVEAASRLLDLPTDAARPSEVSKLASGLRHLGELTMALDVLDHARPQENSASLEALRAATCHELEALTGTSKVMHRSGAVSPLKGRVLHVVGKSVPHFSSGYTIRTKYVVEAQRRAGIDAWVVTEPGFPWSVGIKEALLGDTIDGVTYQRCTAAGKSGDSNIDRMADIVRRLRPSVLHAASDFHNAVSALTLGRAFEIPVIYEVRGVWEETWVSKRDDTARDREHFRLRKKRETECMLAVDRVVTLSETLKAELIRRGVEDNKITVVPNAVDADRFPVQRRDHALARRWGIASGEVTVGYISSLVAYEGIQYLIEAVVDLRKQGRPLRALIVGDGEERDSLEQYTLELGAGDAVIFTGRVPHDEILSYYGLIDVFVIPRTAARVCQLVTPLKPFEAMATGRALVVSGVDALREIVEDGVTGLVFEPEDPADLARQLDRVVFNDALRIELGKNAASWVRQTHTWDGNAETYRSLYQALDVL